MVTFLLVNVAMADTITTRNAQAKLAPGINLGNTLEAIPTVTAWGNPEPTDAYFTAVKKAGFRSIRIPVAWSQYADNDLRISPKWMAFATATVKKANRAGLYVMINIHWDGGWMQPTPVKQIEVNRKLTKFWTQIATNFREFDDRLLFAGTNEVMVDGDYGTPSAEVAAIQNGFNQNFVKTVRSTGGRNANRLLVVQGFNTDIDHSLKFNTQLPKDSAKVRLLFEIHYYSPYNFTLNEKSDIWQWGKMATDPAHTDTWGNEDYVDSQFQKVKAAFIDRGVPVILGEYACGMKPKYPGMDTYRKLWDGYVSRSAYRHGLIPMYWDTGSLFDRKMGQPKDVDVIQSIIQACIERK
jgi:endoglucanase